MYYHGRGRYLYYFLSPGTADKYFMLHNIQPGESWEEKVALGDSTIELSLWRRKKKSNVVNYMAPCLIPSPRRSQSMEAWLLII